MPPKNVVDHFNRVNGAIGSAETGHVWTGDQWSIEENTARRTGGTNGSRTGAELFADAGTPDVEVSATLLANTLQTGVILRHSAPGTHYLAILNTGSTGAYIYRGNNGVYVTLALISLEAIATPRVTVRVRGQTITMFRNGIQVLTATDTDTTLAANTKHGFTGLYRAAGYSTIDDLAIVPALTKIWDGTVWKDRWARIWDGAAWRTRPVRKWDGAQWA